MTIVYSGSHPLGVPEEKARCGPSDATEEDTDDVVELSENRALSNIFLKM